MCQNLQCVKFVLLVHTVLYGLILDEIDKALQFGGSYLWACGGRQSTVAATPPRQNEDVDGDQQSGSKNVLYLHLRWRHSWAETLWRHLAAVIDSSHLM